MNKNELESNLPVNNSNKKLNLLLDLDDVLLHHPSKELEEEHIFFSKKNFLVSCSYGYNYIVPAYLPEFLKYSYKKFNLTFLVVVTVKEIVVLLKTYGKRYLAQKNQPLFT